MSTSSRGAGDPPLTLSITLPPLLMHTLTELRAVRGGAASGERDPGRGPAKSRQAGSREPCGVAWQTEEQGNLRRRKASLGNTSPSSEVARTTSAFSIGGLSIPWPAVRRSYCDGDVLLQCYSSESCVSGGASTPPLRLHLLLFRRHRPVQARAFEGGREALARTGPVLCPHVSCLCCLCWIWCSLRGTRLYRAPPNKP